MERRISFSDGEFYHVYNRGVDKRAIFLNDADYQRFLALLYLANDASPVHMGNMFRRKSRDEIFEHKRDSALVSIGAFCLMKNHFHLLLTPRVDGGVSKFMLKVQTAYSMYFNMRNERSGALFQGVFKAEHADSDEYLQYLYAYIHLNPVATMVKEGASTSRTQLQKVQKIAESYPYSSYSAYLKGDHIISDPEPFPQYFNGRADVKKMHDFWTTYHA